MGCFASKSRRVAIPPPITQLPSEPDPRAEEDSSPVADRSPSTATMNSACTLIKSDLMSAMPPELAKSMSFGGMSSRSGSRHRGQLASVRSQLSIQRSSSARSANSNRSNRSTHSLRDSCGVSTGCDSIKDLKFDAMLEPDAGSSHTLVDSAFRDKGYQWIINQVERKTTAALDVHKKYLDDDVQHDVKLFHGGDVVDAARNRIVLTNLDVFADCLWDTLTESAATPMWRIQRLEEVDAATCYTQVSVVDGISPGHPLVMNVLLRLVRVSVDRQVIVLRSIAEDAKFPLPHQSIAFSVSGWIVLDRTLTPTKRRLGFEQRPRQSTHARSLFRCRASRDRAETQAPDKGFAPMHDDDPDQAAAILGDWLMDAIVRIFRAIESSMLQRPPATDIKPAKR